MWNSSGPGSYTHLDVYKRQAQYCVTVYDQKFDKYNGMGILRPVSEDIQDFYVLTDLEQYSEETGLNLDIDDGMVLWG